MFKLKTSKDKFMKTALPKATLTCLLVLVAFAANAQTWPTQPIKIIVPFTAGTGMDTIARAVAPKLSEKLGQPVVVQNMAGASGNIGADVVAKANPDGYTVFMGGQHHVDGVAVVQKRPF
jgi:tripartite-type tricarboxylate transporter receptor subunit TctC